MAFKIKKKEKENIELVSLIDMIFILLVFFLVTSFVIRMPLQEKGLYIPTPENVLGRAQIVMQFLDENNVFWLDESVSERVGYIEQNFGYLSSEKLKDRILNELFTENIIPYDEAIIRIDELMNRANTNPSSKYFVLIRCPNEVPYYRVMDAIAKISDTTYRNVKYGCVSGTMDQMRNCKRIYTVFENSAQGQRRKNIRIDF